MTSEVRDRTGDGWRVPQRSLADRAVAAFRIAAGTPRQRANPHQVRATRIAAQILEVAAAAEPRTPSPVAAPPDYVPKAHEIRRRRRLS